MDARYQRWDGSQDPLGEPVDVGEALERLGDDLLGGLGGRQALRRLLERGMGGRVGLDDIRRRVRAQRELAEQRTDPTGPLRGVTEELDRILDLERDELDRRDDPDDTFRRMALDAMPPDPASRVRELQQHDFASDEARARFEELTDRLRRELLEATFQQLAAGMESVTAEDLARYREMLADLNRMIAEREAGREPDFDGFMGRHGDLFPEQPRDLDELLEVLAQRMAAMSRLMASLSPEQRRQLQELAGELFDDLDLELELAQLESQLRALAPHLPWDQGDLGGMETGDAPLSEVLDRIDRLTELEQLEEQLSGRYAGATLDDVDEEALRRNLGEDAIRDLRRLREIERELERSGAMTRRGGELELTPKGARLLGERALVSLLDRIRKDPARGAVGADPEPTGQTRPWRFGDREPISVTRSVHNAVLRNAATGGSAQGAVGLHPEDFAVAEQEVRPRTATALLLDLSFSMPLQGHAVPSRRMALALHALISGKHRQDSLHLIGFSDYARPLRPADLAATGFERVYGTNMQHAFLLARRVLTDDPRPVKQVIMVTDGEPTAHLEGDQALFNWPPVPETLEKTLREAMRLARTGIALHIFLLEDAPGLVAFAERLADLTGGQVFRMRGDELGRHLVNRFA